jgi:hypothetical protein
MKTSAKKICPPNKILNPKTTRCINANGALAKNLKLNKGKKKVTSEPPSTKVPPKAQKTPSLKHSTSSYSPSINKTMLSSKNIDKDINIFNCKPDEINVKLKLDKYKCYKWSSKKAQEIMLKHLRSRRYINPENVIGPKQTHNNCWVNTFFMAYFISDKGRKFTKYLRHSMITGVLPNGTKINKTIHRGLFILNKAIDASLIGKADPSNFAVLVDTNTIIRLLYKKIKYRMPGKYGNPLQYFKAITSYLNTSNIVEYKTISPGNIPDILNNSVKPPHVFIANLNLKIPDSNLKDPLYRLPDSVSLKKEYTFTKNNKKYKYKLDSIIVLDTTENHFISLITLNNKEYIFDGMQADRLYPRYNVMSDFISKKNIKVGNKTYNINYYCLAFYYRIR